MFVHYRRLNYDKDKWKLGVLSHQSTVITLCANFHRISQIRTHRFHFGILHGGRGCRRQISSSKAIRAEFDELKGCPLGALVPEDKASLQFFANHGCSEVHQRAIHGQLQKEQEKPVSSSKTENIHVLRQSCYQGLVDFVFKLFV